MLILDNHNVSPCRIRSRKHPNGYAGVTYRNLLFVKAQSFPLSRRQDAARLCQSTLDSGRFCILVWDGDQQQYTLCYQIETAKLASSPAARTSQKSPTPARARANRASAPQQKPRRLPRRRDDDLTLLQRPFS